MGSKRAIWAATTLGVTFVLILSLVHRARAEGTPAGLEMEATAAFNGAFKYGEWLPLWVQLENGGPDVEGEVQVRVSNQWGGVTFAAPVSLPTGSRKRVPVYVLPNSYSRAVEVSLVQGEELLISRDVPVRPQINVSYVVGLVAAERGALSLISGATVPGADRPKVLLDVPISDLPERPEGLRSFDCLIFNDVDTSALTPDQQLALETWVGEGGRLVIGGGSGAQRTVAGLPGSLLALRPRSVVEVNTLPDLEDFADGEPVRVRGPFVVAVGDFLDGRTLLSEGDLSLVRERSVGGGYVDFVALDLATSPFDAWAGTISFWERLALEQATYPQELPADVSARQMRSDQMSYALSNLPSLALPSVRWLAVLLGLYIVLVGPLNYLLLRWRKRLQWAWLTIPSITLAFSAGALGLGYAMRGSDLIMNKVAVVALQSGGRARVDTYMGLFSPSRQVYEIEVQSRGLLSPLAMERDPFGSSGMAGGADMVFVQGRPARVRGLGVNQWSMQTFMVEDMWTDLGAVSTDLRIEGQGIAGRVRNDTAFDLKDVVLVVGSQFVRLGDLAPGQEVEAKLPIDPGNISSFGPPLSYRLFEEQFSQAGPSGPPREAQLKQTVLDSIFSSGKFSPISSVAPAGGWGTTPQGLTLLGWFDRAPPEVLVGGREPTQQTTGLLYAPLTYRLSLDDKASVPPGLLPGRVTQMPQEGGLCGAPGVAAVYIGRGEAQFEFQIPEELASKRIEELVLFIGSDAGWPNPPATAVFDWDREAWAELKDPAIGRNSVVEANGLVAPNGLVRVRLSANANQGGCFTLDLGLAVG